MSRGSVCSPPGQREGPAAPGGICWHSQGARLPVLQSRLAPALDRGAACEGKTVPQELAASHFRCKLIQTCSQSRTETILRSNVAPPKP